MENSGKSGSSTRTTALLLSGLVCPGTGQWKLGRKKRAVVLISAAIIIVMVILLKIFFITNEVAASELMTTFSPSAFYTAFKQIHSRVYSETMPFILAFLGVWLTGLIDIIVFKNK